MWLILRSGCTVNPQCCVLSAVSMWSNKQQSWTSYVLIGAIQDANFSTGKNAVRWGKKQSDMVCYPHSVIDGRWHSRNTAAAGHWFRAKKMRFIFKGDLAGEYLTWGEIERAKIILGKGEGCKNTVIRGLWHHTNDLWQGTFQDTQKLPLDYSDLAHSPLTKSTISDMRVNRSVPWPASVSRFSKQNRKYRWLNCFLISQTKQWFLECQNLQTEAKQGKGTMIRKHLAPCWICNCLPVVLEAILHVWHGPFTWHQLMNAIAVMLKSKGKRKRMNSVCCFFVSMSFAVHFMLHTRQSF